MKWVKKNPAGTFLLFFLTGQKSEPSTCISSTELKYILCVMVYMELSGERYGTIKVVKQTQSKYMCVTFHYSNDYGDFCYQGRDAEIAPKFLDGQTY
jgi:hypothetical protein